MTRAAAAVRIYYAHRRSFPEEASSLLLTADDRLRVTPAMHARRRAEFLAGRALLRLALEQHTGRAAASFRIATGPGGKPECVDGPAISVSHSGEVLVCALADTGAVGIDVETKTPQTSPVAIAESYFTPAEARWLAADPEARFRTLWVLKEAYLKGLGVGLAGGLSALECRIEPPSIVATVNGGSPAPQLALLAGAGCFVGVAALGLPHRAEYEVQHVALVEGADTVGPLELLATTE